MSDTITVWVEVNEGDEEMPFTIETQSDLAERYADLLNSSHDEITIAESLWEYATVWSRVDPVSYGLALSAYIDGQPSVEIEMPIDVYVAGDETRFAWLRTQQDVTG